MATPSPISATRNSTTNDTSATLVSPSRIRNVDRIETPATSSGTSASSEPNTRASTTSAPSAPNSVSTSTPGPLVSPLLPSTSSPVSLACAPGGACALSAFVSAVLTGEDRLVWGGTNAYANSARPSRVRNTGSRVCAYPMTLTCGTAFATAAKVASAAAGSTRPPGGALITSRSGADWPVVCQIRWILAEVSV